MADIIEITILRITQDDEYLEFIVKCPFYYEFNKLYITKYNVLLEAWETTTHDASSLISGLHTNEATIRIATSAISVTSGADYNNNPNVTMYKVLFGATPITQPNPYPPAPTVPPLAWPTVWPTEDIEMLGVCSNINFLYANLLDLVMRFTSCCISEFDYDNLDRNHMMLYAHTEAMRLGRLDEATYFYNLIWKLFTNCGPTTRQNNMMNKPCNCE